MPFYSTDQNKFSNPFAMFEYAARNTPTVRPTFNVFDEAFSKCNWREEPVTSFSTLCDIRVNQLRQQYDYICFFFSGGTDSTTIYNAFRRQGIHIDEITILYDDNNEVGHPASNVKWLLENHNDPTTVITTINRTDQKLIERVYGCLDDDWVTMPELAYSNNPNLTFKNFMPLLNEDGKLSATRCALLGADKPSVYLKDGLWYAVHIDKIMGPYCGLPNTELFYISDKLPELHIKQAHLIKNGAKDFIRKCESMSDIKITEWATWRNVSAFGDLLMITNWCRDSEINVGVSWKQKVWNYTQGIVGSGLLDQMHIQIESVNPVYKGYLEGFAELHSDFTTIEYMKRHNIFPKDLAVDGWNRFFSQSYCLGP